MMTSFEYISFDMLEKLTRLSTLINSQVQSKQSEQAHDAISELFLKSISSLEEELFSLLKRLFNLRHSGPLNNFENRAILQKLSTIYTAYKRIHAQLGNVNSEVIKPEIYTCIEELVSIIDPNLFQKVNVLLGDEYSFNETSLNKNITEIFESIGKVGESTPPGDDGHTVILPKAEYSNPLNWTILCHELAHIKIDVIREIRQKIEYVFENRNYRCKRIFANWTEELFCDLVSVSILGPSYYLSLASFAMLESLNTGLDVSSEVHPPFNLRLSVLYSFLDAHKLGYGDNEQAVDGPVTVLIHNCLAEINELCKLNPFRNISLVEQEDFMMYLNVINGILFKVVEPNLNNQSSRSIISCLKDKLKQGLPIGSYNVREIQALNLKFPPTPEEILMNYEQFKSNLTDRPSTVFDLMNSSWYYKIDVIYLELFNDCIESAELGINPNIANFKRKLSSLDARILASLEVSRLIKIIEG